MKRNKNSKPPQREEHHHKPKALIDEVPSRIIITSPNKVIYSNTNNLLPTPALIKLLEKKISLS
jgi:hypothetical protein